MENFILQLKAALENLPGESAHELMFPTKRKEETYALIAAKDYRESAVAIILFEKEEKVNFVLIQRPDYNGAHSGQVAFPGGKMEKSDENLSHTAKRESREEIGVKESDLQEIGPLTPIYIPVSKFRVSPYIYWWPGGYEFVGDEREVDEILEVELSALLEEDRIKSTHFKVGGGLTLKDIPFFDLAEKRVWGATAIILSEFRAVLQQLASNF